jgi:8-oxo-dGTP pyrophosphatase MutT (NUDIX family)
MTETNNTTTRNESLCWDALETEIVADCEVFLVLKTSAQSKCDLKKRSHFHTIKCNNWVNIIGITDDKKVVLAEQFRHGIRNLTLEIPGGCIDDTDTSPAEAARRELLEETGYSADTWSLLGEIHPNPAILDNLCYTYLAEGIKKIEEPRFDSTGTESIASVLVPLSEIDNLIRQKLITHALVVTAFHFLRLERPDLFA